LVADFLLLFEFLTIYLDCSSDKFVYFDRYSLLSVYFESSFTFFTFFLAVPFGFGVTSSFLFVGRSPYCLDAASASYLLTGVGVFSAFFGLIDMENVEMMSSRRSTKWYL
jgi:hypothetical protein